MANRVGALVGGVIIMVIGMVLATTINSQAETLGAAANIASFSGARAVGDLIPLVYIAAILLAGLGLFGIGAAGFAGRGPLS